MINTLSIGANVVGTPRNFCQVLLIILGIFGNYFQKCLLLCLLT